jgi:hypothetical protein
MAIQMTTCYVSDMELQKLQRIMGPGYFPTKAVRNYEEERRLVATFGCPCDGCPSKPVCQMECSKFERWVSHGLIKPERRHRKARRVLLSSRQAGDSTPGARDGSSQTPRTS